MTIPMAIPTIAKQAAEQKLTAEPLIMFSPIWIRSLVAN
jgi:hypothetical protein